MKQENLHSLRSKTIGRSTNQLISVHTARAAYDKRPAVSERAREYSQIYRAWPIFVPKSWGEAYIYTIAAIAPKLHGLFVTFVIAIMFVALRFRYD